MNTKKIDWKMAATIGSITGVAIGGFAIAAPDESPSLPDSVVLDEQVVSVPRLSAPVVPTTAVDIASEATIAPATTEVPEAPEVPELPVAEVPEPEPVAGL